MDSGKFGAIRALGRIFVTKRPIKEVTTHPAKGRPHSLRDCVRSPVATLLWTVFTRHVCKVGIPDCVVLVLITQSNSLSTPFATVLVTRATTRSLQCLAGSSDNTIIA